MELAPAVLGLFEGNFPTGTRIVGGCAVDMGFCPVLLESFRGTETPIGLSFFDQSLCVAVIVCISL